MSAESAYAALIERAREQSLIGACASVLEWDEDVCMPAGGATYRAEQDAFLARLLHERAADERLGALLDEAEDGFAVGSPEAANLRELRDEYEDARRLPAALVEDLARATTLAQEAWREARDERDGAGFLPWLGKVVALKQAEADCLACGRSRYDTLIDQWEPGLTESALLPMLDRLQGALADLRPRVLERAGARPATMAQPVPLAAQAELVRSLAGWVGFDFERGRLDVAVHPSTSRLGPGDVRLTTRYREDDLGAALFATLHEVGHGLYEQHLPDAHFGEPIGDAPSLGMHESQSRLIENQLGRALPFWRMLAPRLAHLGGAFSSLDPEAAWRAVNHVRPGVDRVTADELSYDLHIMARVELERALIAGDLAVKDVPGAWRDTYARLLGVTPADDLDGYLQDGHWADGNFGYFPTYTIGNAIAAQLMDTLRARVPDLDDRIAAGDLAVLTSFLRDAIHRHGSLTSTWDRVTIATGAPPSIEPLIRYLTAKFTALYDL